MNTYKLFIYDSFITVYENSKYLKTVEIDSYQLCSLIKSYYVIDHTSPSGKSVRYNYIPLSTYLNLNCSTSFLDFRTSIK